MDFLENEILEFDKNAVDSSFVIGHKTMCDVAMAPESLVCELHQETLTLSLMGK